MIWVLRAAAQLNCGGRRYLLTFLALALAMLATPAPVLAKAEVGQRVDIEFTSVEGLRINRAYLDGQIVIVHFWASWYNPSLADLATLLDLQGRYGHKGLTLLGISLDADSLDRDMAIAKHGLSWPQFCDREGWDSHVVKEWDITGIPTAFILDTTGTIAWRGEPANIRAPFQQVWQSMLAQEEARSTPVKRPSVESSLRDTISQNNLPAHNTSAQNDAANGALDSASSTPPVVDVPLDPQAQRLRDAADAARLQIAAEEAARKEAVASLELARKVLEGDDVAAMLDMIDGVADAAVGNREVVLAAKQLAALLSTKVRNSREVQEMLVKRPESVHRLQVLIDPSRATAQHQGAFGESDGSSMHPVLADERYRRAENFRDQLRHYEAYLLYEELDKRAAHLEAGIQARTQLAKYRSRPELIKAVADGKREFEARQALSHAEAHVGQGKFDEARAAYQSVIQTFEGTLSAKQANAALKALP